MADRPILFSAPMINALLDGRKSQTRRLAWREAKIPTHLHDDPSEPTVPTPTIWQKVGPGDRLWCRETHTTFEKEVVRPDGKYFDRVPTVMYAADYEGFEKPDRDWDWEPSIHMPRWASRITLIVTATKQERLQWVGHGEVIAEGTSNVVDSPLWFPRVWDGIYGPGAWDENPDIVAITFTVHKSNIDAMETESADGN